MIYRSHDKIKALDSVVQRWCIIAADVCVEISYNMLQCCREDDWTVCVAYVETESKRVLCMQRTRCKNAASINLQMTDWVEGWMNGRINGRMNGRTDGRLDGYNLVGSMFLLCLQ